MGLPFSYRLMQGLGEVCALPPMLRDRSTSRTKTCPLGAGGARDLVVLHGIQHEEISRSDEADDGNGPAHCALVDPAAEVCANVSADCGENRHLDAEAPLDAVSQNEGGCGDADGDD